MQFCRLGAGSSPTRGDLGPRDDLAEPKVRQLQVPVCADHAVRGLDVTVDDAHAVDVLDGQHQLGEPQNEMGQAQLVAFHDLAEIAALEERQGRARNEGVEVAREALVGDLEVT